ncbi:MAG: LD-carboxypeptidase, partial [Alphaproteobacteria bacterium]|nr:LD-carboxypeptidase [Alphaproteobacteria bacterium]
VRAAAGATRILPYIDYEVARRNAKPVIGFCDNAALMTALREKSGVVALNGFLLTYDFMHGGPEKLVQADLETWLSGGVPEFKGGECVQEGVAEGELLPINLSVLLRLAGTDYFPDLSGKILLVEEVHERMHKIDLMLQQLKQQPNFAALKGLMFGLFTDCSGDAEDGTVEDCVADFLQSVNVPTVKNFAFGHVPARRVLPLGVNCRLDATRTELQIML